MKPCSGALPWSSQPLRRHSKQHTHSCSGRLGKALDLLLHMLLSQGGKVTSSLNKRIILQMKEHVSGLQLLSLIDQCVDSPEIILQEEDVCSTTHRALRRLNKNGKQLTGLLPRSLRCYPQRQHQSRGLDTSSTCTAIWTPKHCESRRCLHFLGRNLASHLSHLCQPR